MVAFLQCITGKPCIGELAPIALYDVHVALSCLDEHLPACGLHDDHILGTDQTIKGGCYGQKLHIALWARGRWAPPAAKGAAIIQGFVPALLPPPGVWRILGDWVILAWVGTWVYALTPPPPATLHG